MQRKIAVNVKNGRSGAGAVLYAAADLQGRGAGRAGDGGHGQGSRGIGGLLDRLTDIDAQDQGLRAMSSTGAMQPRDMFAIMFCTFSGAVFPIKI
jgi:hypothetical protein